MRRWSTLSNGNFTAAATATRDPASPAHALKFVNVAPPAEEALMEVEDPQEQQVQGPGAQNQRPKNWKPEDRITPLDIESPFEAHRAGSAEDASGNQGCSSGTGQGQRFLRGGFAIGPSMEVAGAVEGAWEPLELSAVGPDSTTQGMPTFTAPRHRLHLEDPTAIQPLDLLSALLTDDIVDTFVMSTNACAQAEVKNWVPISKAEFKLYIGIVLYMGFVQVPQREEYFSGLTRQQEVASRMTYKRFCGITTNLHYINTSTWSKQKRKEEKSKDCFYLVTPFVTALAANCRSCYRPMQHLCIDEQCIPFKGRHVARQYNPQKPNKFHLKVK